MKKLTWITFVTVLVTLWAVTLMLAYVFSFYAGVYLHYATTPQFMRSWLSPNRLLLFSTILSAILAGVQWRIQNEAIRVALHFFFLVGLVVYLAILPWILLIPFGYLDGSNL